MSDLGTRLDWVGAIWLTVLALHWLVRWRSKIPGRYISVSGWLIIISAILTLRWPRILGFNTPLEVEYSTRFITYLIASYLQFFDWQIFRELTPLEKNRILEMMPLLNKRKSRQERNALKKGKYVEREKYDLIVSQLALLEALKKEKEKEGDEKKTYEQ